MTVDLRFAAFVRITRDPELRRLLVNHADRIDHDRHGRGAPPGTPFLALTWSPLGSAGAACGAELLTARVHVPRGDGRDPRLVDTALLETVPRRLEAALTVASLDPPVRALWLGTSCVTVDGTRDTLSQASTFEISAAPPGRGQAVVPRLTPRTAGRHRVPRALARVPDLA
ncbi:MAG TPA: hypothetical protein VKZ81_18565 [Pseudonocardia sp.]|uniref:hypothetical protein n=1 Tax=Pseudonocardia sp. TaxID=60912 RepID=UPI002B4B547D|nr:hypothetical protein [Pseudonocardia sp.]HLU57463.1 hypothetical protein [Pseudonocardia sp.]